MTPILCIGETKQQRDSGKTQEILSKQLSILCKNFGRVDSIVIAYEPIWAIGTGIAATTDMIYEAHQVIRMILNDNANSNEISILYGGSVTSENSSDIIALKGISGFLIGGSSLNVNEFYNIYLNMIER